MNLLLRLDTFMHKCGSITLYSTRIHCFVATGNASKEYNIGENILDEAKQTIL